MATRIDITDPRDPRLDDYRNIPDPSLVARGGLFVAEGRLVVERLLGHPTLRTRSVMVTATALAALEPALAGPGHEALPVYVVDGATIATVAGFHIHRGALAIGVRPAPRAWLALVAGARRLVALERVANADNVGGIFRAAAALGADGVLLGPACTDPLYRKAIRTSMAATLLVPFASAEPWPAALETLAAQGWETIGLTPAAHAAPLPDVARLTRGRPCVLAVGHEGEGLSPGALAACTRLARIPMRPAHATLVDSLNVTTAAAIGLYALAGTDDTPGEAGP